MVMMHALKNLSGRRFFLMLSIIACAFSVILFRDIPLFSVYTLNTLKGNFCFTIDGASTFSSHAIAYALLGIIGIFITIKTTAQLKYSEIQSHISFSVFWLVALILYVGLTVYFEYSHLRENSFLPSICFIGAILLAYWTYLRISEENQDTFQITFLEIVPLLAILVCSIWFWLHDEQSWKYSMIGDETAFFQAASDLLKANLSEWRLTDAFGVYWDHPKMVSIIQAVFLYLFGENSYGWKASSAFMCAISALALYLFVKERSGKLIGYGAVIIFTLSVMVVAWAKIGKPHAFIYPAVAWTSFFILRSRMGSLRYTLLAGIASGLGFYLFILSAYVSVGFGLTVYGWRILQSRFSKQALRQIGIYLMGVILIALPILLQTQFFIYLFSKNLAEQHISSMLLVKETFLTAISFLHYRGSNHFIFGEILDPVSSFLLLLGFGVVIKRGEILELLIFALVVFFCGTISYYNYPTVTRILLLSIPWALIAASGVRVLDEGFGKSCTRYLLLPVMFITSCKWNWDVWASDQNRMLNFHQIVARYVQADPKRSVIFIAKPERNIEVDNLAFRYANHPAIGVSACTEITEENLKPFENLEIILEDDVLINDSMRTFIKKNHIPIYRFPTQAVVKDLPEIEPLYPINDVPAVTEGYCPKLIN